MQQWTEQEFVGRDFTDEDFAGLATERVVFTECDFTSADLSRSTHAGSAFRNCRFRRTALWHSTIRYCSLLGSTFEECRLRPIACEEVDFSRPARRRPVRVPVPGNLAGRGGPSQSGAAGR